MLCLPRVLVAAWSPDGKFIVAVQKLEDDTGTELHVFDAQTGRKIRQLGKSMSDYREYTDDLGDKYEVCALISHLAWSPDGSRVASYDRFLSIWDAQTGTLVWTSRQPYVIRCKCLVWTPDSARVLFASAGDTCNVYDIMDANENIKCYRRHDLLNGTACAAFSPDCSQLLTGDADGALRLWPFSKTPPDSLTQWNKFRSWKWSPTPGTVLPPCLIPPPPRTEWGHISGPSTKSVSWSPDGTRFATALHSKEDGKVMIWDAATRTTVASQSIDARTLAWSPDGQRLACAVKKTVCIYSTSSWTVEQTVKFRRCVHDLIWSPSSTRLMCLDGRSARFFAVAN